MTTQHSSHPRIVKRLKRASGHLARVIEMMAEERPCVDIAQQLHAVERAISNAKSTLIHDHLSHCLDDLVDDRSSLTKNERAAELSDFKEIARYL